MAKHRGFMVKGAGEHKKKHHKGGRRKKGGKRHKK